MSIVNTEIFPFKKYVECFTKLLFREEKRLIKGTFKDVQTGEMVSGDDFEAHVLGTAEQTYRAYLGWWNRIRYEHEHEREYVSAEWEK